MLKIKSLLIPLLCLLSLSAASQTTSELHKPLRNLVITDPRQAFQEARELINEGKRKKDISMEATGKLIEGNVFWILGELPNALDNYYEAIELYEKSKDRYGLVTTYNDASLIYIDEGDFEDGLEYLFKSKNLNQKLGDVWLDAVIYSNIGNVYLEMNALDSARFYTETSLEYAEETGDHNIYPFILKNMGRIFLSEGNLPQAKSFYLEAVELSEEIRDDAHLVEILNEIGDYYWKNEHYDSARILYQDAYVKAKAFDSEKWIFNTSSRLENYFVQVGRYDSAYAYSRITLEARNNIQSAEIVKNTLRLKNLEDIRQAEQEERRKVEKEARQHLIEYLVIICAIFFMISFVFFLRKIAIPVVMLEVWLVVSLLLFFEFITLLIHSFAGELTHHSPILMLLILVVIAAVLGPAHHYSHKFLKQNIIK